MKVSDFDYYLPEDLIAQTPIKKRDDSRMLVLNRNENKIEHRHFFDCIDYLNPGDVLVINDTKVIPARLFGEKADTGRNIEVFLLKRKNYTDWQALLRPGKKVRIGDKIKFSDGLTAVILEKLPDGVAYIRFEFDGIFEEILLRLGNVPLPPYIKKELNDSNRYQTIYAEHDGSCAAPTAGLHFTNELMDRIKEKGVDIVPVLLHVGLGTFRPVKTEIVEEHKMHSEYFSVEEESAIRINKAKSNGGRVIAVGTTSVRVLESCCDQDGYIKPISGDTDIFIYPGYKFKAVDSLITNFHLPKSTLLMLVSAFAGRERILDAYNKAVENRYRFFSFGDSMLIV